VLFLQGAGNQEAPNSPTTTLIRHHDLQLGVARLAIDQSTIVNKSRNLNAATMNPHQAKKIDVKVGSFVFGCL
jgi:hypothetical protein